MTSSGEGEIKKRSVYIAGHQTSVTIETIFWALLSEEAAERGLSINQLVTEIDACREGNLSSAIRVHVLKTVLGKTPND